MSKQVVLKSLYTLLPYDLRAIPVNACNDSGMMQLYWAELGQGGTLSEE
jgi:hypothetical protein